MALEPGTRLGAYEIVALLGAGGMGEVYRARDKRLDRTVAIKVLPAALGDDPELRRRLEREARAVSSLDHPRICTLYDIGREPAQPSSSDREIDFLVMQYVEGETLAARLERGPFPLDEALRLGSQIAEALFAAHRRGIVHRDLKPANVMLTRDGVLLLDFGLAKPYLPVASTGDAETMAAPLGTVERQPLTRERTILGTLHYMAPEQLEGRDADARTDMFAFGALLYEMVTGRRAFDGDSPASVITAVMTGQRTPFHALAPAAPPALGRLIDRCLAIHPDDRWQSAGDMAYVLTSLQDLAAVSAIGPERRRSRWPVLAGAAGLVALMAAVAAVTLPRPDGEAAPAAELRLSVTPPPGFEFANDAADFDPEFAISPDGTRLAFVAVSAAGIPTLWVRELSSVTARELSGTAGARRPFWSPDGRQIAYLTDTGFSRVAVDGGAPRAISSSYPPSVNATGSWGAGGQILFEGQTTSDGRVAKRLYLVPDSGGTAVEVPRGSAPRDEQAQRFPVFLPDGRHFLYLSWTSDPAEHAIYLGSTDDEQRTLLVKTGFKAALAAPDVLFYVRDRALVAQRLSLDPARLIGEPRMMVDGLALEAIPGGATFAASESGVVAYRSRSRDLESELRWVDRGGRYTPVITGSDITVSLAPGEGRAALTRVITSSASEDRFPSNVWLLDLTRRIPTRFTLDSASTDENPIWSVDGRSIAYASHRGSGLAEVYVQPASAGSARVVASGPQNFHPIHWARDGTLLLHAYATGTGADDMDLWVLGPEAGAEPQPFLVEPASQSQGQFSPDGRWIAYTSDESGRAEVYVRPFPAGPFRVQISSEGGAQPRWHKDGQELFYISPSGALMAVPVASGAGELSPGVPIELFTEPALRTNNNVFFYGGAAAYDVSEDGQRFLITRLTREPSAGPIHLVIGARY